MPATDPSWLLGRPSTNCQNASSLTVRSITSAQRRKRHLRVTQRPCTRTRLQPHPVCLPDTELEHAALNTATVIAYSGRIQCMVMPLTEQAMHDMTALAASRGTDSSAHRAFCPPRPGDIPASGIAPPKSAILRRMPSSSPESALPGGVWLPPGRVPQAGSGSAAGLCAAHPL